MLDVWEQFADWEESELVAAREQPLSEMVNHLEWSGTPNEWSWRGQDSSNDPGSSERGYEEEQSENGVEVVGEEEITGGDDGNALVPVEVGVLENGMADDHIHSSSGFTPSSSFHNALSNLPGHNAEATDSTDDPFDAFNVGSGSMKEFLIEQLRRAPQEDAEIFRQAQRDCTEDNSTIFEQWDTSMTREDFEETEKSAREMDLEWQEYKFMENATAAEAIERMDQLFCAQRDGDSNMPLPGFKHTAPYLDLREKVQEFARSHRFATKRDVKPTTQQRRKFTRDIYDYARAIGMRKNQALFEIKLAVAQYRKDRGFTGSLMLDESDDESTLGPEVNGVAQQICLMNKSMHLAPADPEAWQGAKRLGSECISTASSTKKPKPEVANNRTRKQRRERKLTLEQGEVAAVDSLLSNAKPAGSPMVRVFSQPTSDTDKQSGREKLETVPAGSNAEENASPRLQSDISKAKIRVVELAFVDQRQKKKKKRKQKKSGAVDVLGGLANPRLANEYFEHVEKVNQTAQADTIISTKIDILVENRLSQKTNVNTKKQEHRDDHVHGTPKPLSELISMNKESEGQAEESITDYGECKFFRGYCRGSKRSPLVGGQGLASGEQYLDVERACHVIDAPKQTSGTTYVAGDNEKSSEDSTKAPQLPDAQCDLIVHSFSKTWTLSVMPISEITPKLNASNAASNGLESVSGAPTANDNFSMSESCFIGQHSNISDPHKIKVDPEIARMSPCETAITTPKKRRKKRSIEESLETPPSGSALSEATENDGPGAAQRHPTSSNENSALKKKPPKISPFFSPPTSAEKLKSSPSREKKPRARGGVTSCIPFPPLSAQSFGLLQENLCKDPFRLLVGVTFLNRTMGKHAIPVFFSLMDKYPTPADIIAAERDDIISMTHHLGLQAQRAETYKKYAYFWIHDPPRKGIRYRVDHYPGPGDGMNIKKGEMINDDDLRCAWEIGHMTQGRYAIDSWRIFCRDILRGEAEGWNGEGRDDGFQPEWMRVLPRDKELIACLRWMWLKEGFEWDPVTGEKEVARRELMEAAIAGNIAWDNQGGMRIYSQADDIPHGEGNFPSLAKQDEVKAIALS